eukprot:137224-Pelagomonas_calceolata.AAC.2
MQISLQKFEWLMSGQCNATVHPLAATTNDPPALFFLVPKSRKGLACKEVETMCGKEQCLNGQRAVTLAQHGPCTHPTHLTPWRHPAS